MTQRKTLTRTHKQPSAATSVLPKAPRPTWASGGGPPTAMGNTSVAFVGLMFAGHAARFRTLRECIERDGRLLSSFHEITGRDPDGRIERIPGLPVAFKGRLRTAWDTREIARFPRPAALWATASPALTPHLWSQVGGMRRPLVLDMDWTVRQQEELASLYFRRAAKRGARLRLSLALESLLLSRACYCTPWSHWAADGLVEAGVERSRIRVIPPGVDLQHWARVRRSPRPGPLRMVFVGADFWRKGGDLVIEAMRARPGLYELDVVTTAAVPESPGVRVHRAAPNSPELQSLYARAELFVMPSRAECFGLATIEAMASGLPVLVGDAGGVRDIVKEGQNGWIIPPRAGDLLQVLDIAAGDRERLARYGARGREIAECKFDANRNAGELVDLILQAIDEDRSL